MQQGFLIVSLQSPTMNFGCTRIYSAVENRSLFDSPQGRLYRGLLYYCTRCEAAHILSFPFAASRASAFHVAFSSTKQLGHRLCASFGEPQAWQATMSVTSNT